MFLWRSASFPPDPRERSRRLLHEPARPESAGWPTTSRNLSSTLRFALFGGNPPPHSSVLAVKWLATNFGFSQNFPRFE